MPKPATATRERDTDFTLQFLQHVEELANELAKLPHARADDKRIHVPAGREPEAGRRTAEFIDGLMRSMAEGRTDAERVTARLCDGCFQMTVVDAVLALCEKNAYDPQDTCELLSGVFGMVARRAESMKKRRSGIDYSKLMIDRGDDAR